MSILDQLFGDTDGETVPTNDLSPLEWVNAATSLSVHQAIMTGMYSQDPAPWGKINSRPRFGSTGIIDVTTSLRMLKDYKRLIVEEQLRDLRYNPTANDVVEGGIKEGSKIIIEVVSEGQKFKKTAYELVKAKMTRSGEQDVRLVFDKFSVMSIMEPDSDRYQIHETFGADLIQSFGKRPKLMTLSGQIVNGKVDVKVGNEIRSMDWKNAFQRFYERYGSLHACAKSGDKVRIYAQDTIFEGYLLDFSANTTAMDQGISAVTLTYVIARRFFMRDNDHLIPGMLSEGGFKVTGGETPEEFFSQAKLEDHFDNDYSTIQSTEHARVSRQIRDMEKRISSLDGGIDTAKIQSNVENSKNDEHMYLAPHEGLRLHKFLKDSSLHVEMVAQGLYKKELKNNIRSYNLAHNVPDNDEDPIYLKGVPDYYELKRTQSKIALRRRGIVERARKLNDLAIQLQNLVTYRDRLEDSSIQAVRNNNEASLPIA